VLPLARARECDHFARPLLLNNIGAAYMAIGDREKARDYFEKAKQDLGSYPSADLELTSIDRNLALLTSDDAQRTALAKAVWQRLRDALGEAHPTTLDALSAYSAFEPDPSVAYE